MPKVSVILTTYNRASTGFLEQAIESVLNQTFKDFELLIVDDGSTDNTKEVCRKYLSYERVKYIYQKNRGLAGARNIGIKKSLGKYICFLDDDDVWLPEKLATQISFIENLDDPKFGLCHTALKLIDQNGKETGEVQSHDASGYIFEELLCENIVDGPSSVLIPKFVFDDIGLFDENFGSFVEDYYMWLNIAKKYNVYSVKEPLVLYRVLRFFCL